MERKSLFRPNQNASGGGNRPETFAFIVDGYDLSGKDHAVFGRRLDGGAKVRVTLRQNIETKNSEHARAEIADFAAKRGNMLEPGTSEGGILLAQEAFLNADGAHAARWIQVLSHAPGEAEVFCASITVSPVKVMEKVENGRKLTKFSSYMQLVHSGNFDDCSDEVKEALKVTPPFVVDNTAELEEAIAALLLDELGVGVRVSGKVGFDGTFVKFDRKKFHDLKTDAEKTTFAEAAAKEYVTSIESVAADINSGDLTCEVIPYSTIWAGPKTAQAMKGRPHMQVRVDRFNSVVERPGKAPLNYSVYRPAIVAVRKTSPDPTTGRSSVYFSHFEPLNTMNPVRGISDAIAFAATSVLSPEIPAPQSAANANQSAPAAAPAANQPAAVPGQAANDGAAARSNPPADFTAQGGSADDLGASAGGFPVSGTDDDLMFEASLADSAGGADHIGDDVLPGASTDAAAQEAPAQAPPARRYMGRRAA